MTTPAPEPDQQPSDEKSPDEKSDRSLEAVLRRRMERRRERVRTEIAQARSGDHTVPTWVLAAVLGLMVAGWLYLIFFG